MKTHLQCKANRYLFEHPFQNLRSVNQTPNEDEIFTHIKLPLGFKTAINQVFDLLIRQWIPQYLLPRLHILGTRPGQVRTRRLHRLNPFLMRRRQLERIEFLQFLLARRQWGPTRPRPAHRGRAERRVGRLPQLNGFLFRGLGVAVFELKWRSVDDVRKPIVADRNVSFPVDFWFLSGNTRELRGLDDSAKRGVRVGVRIRVLGVFGFFAWD